MGFTNLLARSRNSLTLGAVKTRTTIHDLLDRARTGLKRLTAIEADGALRKGAVIVDTRSAEQRRDGGVIPGARHHPLSVLEWRLDPTSEERDPDISLDDWVVVVCAQGYSSSLAAERLQALGFHRATDLIDGVEGWRSAGLPLLGEGPDPSVPAPSTN